MKTFSNCLLCGSGKLKPAGEKYAHAFLSRCETCGFVFCTRVPTAEELAVHYGGYPRDTKISPLTVKRYNELLEKFEPYRKTNAILDIGCGDGHFLAAAKEKGWNVYGTEFTKEAVAVCKAKGIAMHEGALVSFMPTEKFDVITSFEVMEHINNPVEEVQKIHSLMREGGLFYFTTPNFNSLSRRWLGGKWNVIEYPEHLCYYTKRTITKLLCGNGFKKVKLITSGFSVSRMQASRGNETDGRNADEKLRVKMEKNTLLGLVKRSVNFFLELFSAGDSLKGYFESR